MLCAAPNHAFNPLRAALTCAPAPRSNPLGLDLILCAEQAHPLLPRSQLSLALPGALTTRPTRPQPGGQSPRPTLPERPQSGCICVLGPSDNPVPPLSTGSSGLPGDGARPLPPLVRRCGLPKLGWGGGFGQSAGSLHSRQNQAPPTQEDSKFRVLGY